jgi:hypothetical protein
MHSTALLAAWLMCGHCEPSCQAQDGATQELVSLPPLNAYKLPKDEYLIFNVRTAKPNAEFIRGLRKVPAIHPEGTPTSLIIEKYLHKKSQAVSTDFCYIESDWLSANDLALIAAVTQKSVAVTQDLVKNSKRGTVKLVLVKNEQDYYSLVDAWASSDKTKKQARHAASAVIENYRCGYRTELLEVLTLASADAVTANLEPHLWNQPALSDGLHTYLTSFLGLGFEHYISLEATTPAARREAGVRQLFETARDYLARPKRDTLETILRSELNSLTPERRAVTVAVIHYIFEVQNDHWEEFLSVLDKESYHNGDLKGPEGLWLALKQAIKVAFHLEVEELDRELQKFSSSHYLYTEEIAAAIGVDRDCAESSFQAFVKICELKRQKKPVSDKGEKLYQEILDRIDKKLQTKSERF